MCTQIYFSLCPQVLHDLMNERKDWEASRTIKEEDENVSPTTPTGKTLGLGLPT